ncbi:MAG: hypothetical protein J6Q38_01325 [Clostridia bacterium]|nr:hypothetical protein [Clostridia bacterium]
MYYTNSIIINSKPNKIIGGFTMLYELKNNRTGEDAVYRTTVEITEKQV